MTTFRTRHRRLAGVSAGLAAVLTLGAACSTEDQVNDALEDAGVDGNVSLGGDLPDGFPTDDVPTPDLNLETGVAAAGLFTLRYTSDDPAADVAAYRSELAEDGFTIASEFDNLADPAAGGNVGFTANGDGWSVTVSAFSPDAPGGGNYMGVVVQPV